jgi:hypothetical protein
MSSTIRRGKVIRADLALYDGRNSSYTRTDASGGTITGLPIGTEVDVLQVYGSGTDRTRATIAAAVNGIGSSAATLGFSPGTWTVDSSITIPSNLTSRIARGCVFSISAGQTLTFSGPVQRESETWTSGAGSVSVTATNNVLLHTQDAASVVETQSNSTPALDSLIRTAPEISAGVTPVNYAYPPYTDSRRHDAKCDGSTDDTSKLQAQLTAASTGTTIRASRRVGLVATDNADYFRCTSGLTFNPLDVLVDGNGNTLDFSDITSGAFVGLTLDVAATSLNIAEVAAAMGARGLRNVVVSMPSYTVNADGVGVRLTDSVGSGGNYFGPRHRIDSLTIFGGNVGIHFSRGAFAECLTGLTVMHGVGHLLNIAIYADSTWPNSDGGESPSFYGTFIASAQTGVWLTGGSMRFIGGNIDGCKVIFKQDQIGTISAYGTYFEFVDGDDTEFKFDASDANSRIELVDVEFGVRADVGIRATKPMFNNAGTLILRNATFVGAGTQWYTANGGFLVTGSGSVFAAGVKWVGMPWWPLISKSLQWLAYPDINNANALAPFSLSNTGAGNNPVRATSVSDGSTARDAIDFEIGAGGVLNDDSAAEFSHAVTSGRAVSIVGAYYCPSITGANVTLQIANFVFKDSAGNTISGPFDQTLTSTTVASWTTFPGFTLLAPAGAETVTFVIRLLATGAVASAKHCYISPLGIGYADGA